MAEDFSSFSDPVGQTDFVPPPDPRIQAPNAQAQQNDPFLSFSDPVVDDAPTPENTPGIINQLQSLKTAVVGQNEFDLPEFFTIFDQTAQSSIENISAEENNPFPTSLGEKLTRINLARDDEDKQAKIAELFPGTTFDTDKFGNVIVNHSPLLKKASGIDRSVLNKGGISAADIQNVGTDLAFGLPLAIPAARVGQLAGRAGQAIGAGVGEFAGSLTRDAAAEVEPDFTTAALAGIFTVAGEGTLQLLAPAFKKISQGVRGTRLSADEQSAVRSVGLDPDDLTPEFVNQFKAKRTAAENPDATTLQAVAASLPGQRTVDKFSTGQLTGDPRQLSIESQLKEAGGQAENVRNPLQEQQDDLNEALKLQTRDVQAELGPNAAPTDRDAASIVVQRVRKLHKKDKQKNDARFKAARQSGRDVNISNETFSDAPAELKTRLLDENIRIPELSGRVALLVKKFSFLSGKIKGFNVTKANINALENLRRGAVKVARDSSDPAERITAGKLVEVYDETVRATIDGSTDPALAIWKEATTKHKEFAKRWQQHDVVGDILKKQKDGSHDFVVGADEAVDVLFSRGKLGSKKDLARNFKKLKKVLGPNSPQWGALREAAFLRLFKTQSPDALVPGSKENFSGAKFATELTELLRKDAAVKELFSPVEVQMLKNLKIVALAAEKSPAGIIKGRVGASGTPAALAAQSIINATRTAAGPLGRVLAVPAQFALDRLIPTLNKGAAIPAARGTLPNPAPSVLKTVPTAVATGATAADQTDGDAALNRLPDLLRLDR